MDNKQLYKISKYSLKESFLEAQLMSAGSQQAKIMEKMEQNKKYLTNQSVAMKIITLIYVGALVVLPIITYFQINQALEAGIYEGWVTFAGSLTYAIFFLIQALYLIIFGLFYSAGILSGESIKWLTTLPLTRKDLQKISMFTFFRGFDIQMIGITLIFPIGIAIATQSIQLTLIALLLSLINNVFAFSLLLVLGGKLNQVLKDNEANSKKSTIIRILVLGSYAIGSLFIALMLQFAIQMISNIYLNPTMSNSTVDTVNTILALIPIPFSGGYLMTDAMMSFQNVNSLQIILVIVGMFLFIGITWILFRKGLKALNNVFSHENKGIKGEGKKTTIEDIKIEITTPIKAFVNKDKQMATRDIQMMMFFIMPVLLPLIGFVTLQFSAGDIQDPQEMVISTMAMTILYLIIGAMMLSMGLISVESTGHTILSSLPIRIRDQALAKLKIEIFVLTLSTFVPLILFIGSEEFFMYLAVMLIIFLIGPIFGIGLLELKVRLFGKLRYKYVLEEINLKNKIGKWILLIASAIMMYIVIMIVFVYLLSTYNLGILALVFIPFEILIIILERYIFNRMFPKHQK